MAEPRSVERVSEERVRAGGAARRGGRLGAALGAAKSSRGLVTVALSLAMIVTALEQTVVSTAMPSIIAQLKGIDVYPWVFSAYLLASTISTPIYGKLADLLGRKRVLLFGLGLFALGSVFSGLAQTMPQLIAMRVVQGLGAGAVSPVVLTMLGDLFTLEERAKVQGVFSAIWGVSSVAGPALGGILTDRLSWRWTFFVSVPFAAVSIWILSTQVKESLEKREVKPIDWAGAGLLTAASTALLLAVLHGGDPSARGTFWLFAVALVLGGAFVAVERRAADPVLPIDLLRSPEIAAAVAVSFVIGALLFGLDTYVPLFVQGVKGGTATEAGQLLTPLFLPWAVSVAVAAKLVGRFGYRRTAVVGSVLIAAGVAALAVGAAFPARSAAVFVGGMVVIGLGMGPTSLSTILGVQNAVPWGRRGAATASVLFFRTMGGALVVGALGASVGLSMARRLAHAKEIDVTAALRPETHKLLTPGQLATVQGALGRSLRDVFLEMTALAVVSLACALFLRAGRASSHNDAGAAPDAPRVPNGEDLGLAVGLEH